MTPQEMVYRRRDQIAQALQGQGPQTADMMMNFLFGMRGRNAIKENAPINRFRDQTLRSIENRDRERNEGIAPAPGEVQTRFNQRQIIPNTSQRNDAGEEGGPSKWDMLQNVEGLGEYPERFEDDVHSPWIEPTDEEKRGVPPGYNEPTFAGPQVAGEMSDAELLEALKGLGGDEPVDGGYGPSIEFGDKTGGERVANEVQQKYISQGIDIKTMHPLELQIANELLTTDQTRRNALFANEVIFANAILDDIDREGVNWFAEAFTGNSPYIVKLPGNLGNMVVGSKRQAYDMAKRLFIEGVLRPKTGAVINYSAEEPTYKETFFPTPFDTPETIALKRGARKIEEHGVINQAGPLYKAPNLADFLPPEYLGETPIEGQGEPDSDGWMEIDGVRVRMK